MTDQELIDKLKVGGIVSIRDYLLEQQAKGLKIARTESGDPSFSIPNNVKIAMNKALLENKTHYTAGAGIKELREAIFQRTTNYNNLNLNSYNDIIITNGAMNALFGVFHSIVDNKGYKILVPTPTWTETAINVTEVGGTPVYYKFNPFSDTPIDINELEELVNADSGIKAIVVNSPHNPTGKVLSLNNLKELIAFSQKHDLYLISDEAYEHVIFDGIQHISPASLSDYDKIITIFSFSKSYVMSGLRLGCACTTNKNILKKLSKIVRCTINGVSSVTQWGGVSAVLETPKEYFDTNLAEYTVRRNAIYNGALHCKHLVPVKPEGTFYLWCKIKESWRPEITINRSWHMTLEYLKLGIGSAPGEVFGPGGTDQIRFSFSCSTEDVKLAADLLKELK
ncbi:MAG: pyridoxal phosphate-dependent aminotransferase [Bacteroidales bacterium]|jgi:aspartate aminotransferase|nr:pyridoxal phosphate-dependent aminotransferase [Bacteroidales bacterium]